MDAKTRIIVNTSAQYIKTIVSGVITLYSSRVILSSLGVDDFGIYTLVAGVVMMLSFLTNALSSTTQRFISYYQGSGEMPKVKAALTNSLCIHAVLGLIFAVLFLTLTPFLFNGFLNISSSRIGAATSIYFAVISTLFVSFLNAPYRAVLISHENIVYISVIDTLDASLKLLIALSLSWVGFDKLVFYGWALLIIQLFDLVASALFCYIKYEECTWPRFGEISRPYMKGLMSFAGWNIYSLACTYGRTQGIAIVLNKFLGTAVNAAYGIGIQLTSYANYMSESLLNAIRPQIIKAEGAEEREKMFLLSEKASKFSFFLLSLLSIPCVFEMPQLLHLWLGTYPQESQVFCQCFLLASLVDSLTIGLHTANQAIGNLKRFALVINTTKLFTLPIALLLLNMGYGAKAVGISYVAIEFLCALLRMYVMRPDSLDVRRFLHNVFGKITIPLMAYLIIVCIIEIFVTSNYRALITFASSLLIYTPLIYIFGLERNEQELISSIINKLFKKVIKRGY